MQVNDPEYIEVLLVKLSATTDFMNPDQLKRWQVRTRSHLNDRPRGQLLKALRLMEPIEPEAWIFTRRNSLIDRIMNEWIRRMQTVAKKKDAV